MVDIGVLSVVFLIVIMVCIVGAKHRGKLVLNLFKYLCTLHQLTGLVKGETGCRLPKEQRQTNR